MFEHPSMSYYIVSYTFENGTAPAIPDCIGYMLLAQPGQGRSGIFQCSGEVPPSSDVRQIDEQLRELIWSAERYPPALALARDQISEAFADREPTDVEFCDVYRKLLIEHMRQQHVAPYVFAEAVADEPGYLAAGQFYWVLRYLRGSDAVKWVSADYWVYENPMSDFVLSSGQLSKLLMPFPAAV